MTHVELISWNDLGYAVRFEVANSYTCSSLACSLIYLFIQGASNARHFMNTIFDIFRLLSRRFRGELLPTSWRVKQDHALSSSYQPPVFFFEPCSLVPAAKIIPNERSWAKRTLFEKMNDENWILTLWTRYFCFQCCCTSSCIYFEVKSFFFSNK